MPVVVLLHATSACFQAKRQYEKAFRDWEKVQEAHCKTEQDINIPRVDVEKVRHLSRSGKNKNYVTMALFLALSLSPGSYLVSLWCDHSMLASLL